MRDDLVFFLGGHDLEMVAIRELVEAVAVPGRLHDKSLAWGARASAYRVEIEQARRSGLMPVLVELEEDIGLAAGSAIFVDHHGDRAGTDSPSSLRQVFRLLELPDARWSRWQTLVEANDTGYIEGLVQAGATPEELRAVRAADRAAQGITPEEEVAAARAAAGAEFRCAGQLVVVELPHARTAAVEDRLHVALGGPGYQNLVVLSPDETNFSGEGPVVTRLASVYAGSWWGGSLPRRGYWGMRGRRPEVVAVVEEALGSGDANA